MDHKYLSYTGLKRFFYTKILNQINLKIDKTNGDISNTKIRSVDTIETKYPIPAAGETAKQFLGKVMTFLTNIQPLASSITRYASSTTGSDSTGDGSSVKPFRTIQRALDSIPHDLNGYSASIYVADGSYSGFIVRGFYNGALLVTGNTTNATLVGVKLSSPTYVRETTATIEVSGFYFNGFENTTASFCVGVINATRVSIHHCTINCGTSGTVKNHGILSHSCNLAAYNCEFNNCARCVYSDHSTATPPANTKVWANTGIDNDTAYYCYGGTISLGGGTVPQSSGGNSVGSGGIIVSKYGGSIGTLQSNTTLYVATTGSDTSGDGTSSKPYRTISNALNTIPKDLGGCVVTINLADGTYDEEVRIPGYHGGIIDIKSSSSPEVLNTVCRVRRIYANDCSARLRFYGLYMTQKADDAFYIANCSFVLVVSCQAVEDTAPLACGFNFTYSTARLYGCKCMYHRYCCRSYLSDVSSEEWISSSATDYGLLAERGGKIAKTGSQPSGDIRNESTSNGGTITEANGTQILGITKTGLSCTWGTIGGGYNRYGNNNAAMVTIQTKITLSAELTANTDYVISGFPKAALDTACTCSNQTNTFNCYIDTTGQLKYRPLNGNTSGAVLSFNCTYLTVV